MCVMCVFIYIYIYIYICIQYIHIYIYTYIYIYQRSSKWKIWLLENLSSFPSWLHLANFCSEWQKKADKKYIYELKKLISLVYKKNYNLIVPIDRAPQRLYLQCYSYRCRSTRTIFFKLLWERGWELILRLVIRKSAHIVLLKLLILLFSILIIQKIQLNLQQIQIQTSWIFL